MTDATIDTSAGTHPGTSPTTSVNPFGALAGYVSRAGPGERAALARLEPEALRPHEIAALSPALSRALLSAGLQPERWRAETWPRWALIAHGMALAGHDGGARLGRQLAHAGVAESRVTRLLTARGDAFRQLLPRVLRLLASKGVRPNWFELGELVLKEDSADADDLNRTDELRLRIAGNYFSAFAARN
jgi:CRISPR system Cascade subunit CasB